MHDRLNLQPRSPLWHAGRHGMHFKERSVVKSAQAREQLRRMAADRAYTCNWTQSKTWELW
jgi:hypothetical protein